MARDYLGILKLEEGDKLDYGVLGMKWGQRRTKAQLAAVNKMNSELDGHLKKHATAGTNDSPEYRDGREAILRKHTSDPSLAEARVEAYVKRPPGEESSQAKYNRLMDQAKAKGPNSLDEADLKFVNARTEAIAKVNKMNKKDPGWLGPTVKKVRETAAQKVMQEVTDAIAKKYITTPITKALTDNSAAIAKESKTPVDYVGKHRAKKK